MRNNGGRMQRCIVMAIMMRAGQNRALVKPTIRRRRGRSTIIMFDDEDVSTDVLRENYVIKELRIRFVTSRT